LVVHWVKQGEKGYALCIPHIKWLMIGWEVGSSIGRSQENHLTWLKSQWLGNHLMFAAYKKDIKFHARYWLLMIIFLYIYISYMDPVLVPTTKTTHILSGCWFQQVISWFITQSKYS
jgi:hypothetical protein